MGVTQKSLRYEIAEMERVIAIKKELGKDCKFEQKLAKGYRKHLQE